MPPRELRKVKIEEDVFKRVTIILVGSKKDLDVFTQKNYGTITLLGDNNKVGGCCVMETDNGLTFQLVWLEKFNRRNDEDVSILSHELNHVAYRIVEALGIELGTWAEPLCYYQEFLLLRALNKLK